MIRTSTNKWLQVRKYSVRSHKSEMFRDVPVLWKNIYSHPLAKVVWRILGCGLLGCGTMQPCSRFVSVDLDFNYSELLNANDRPIIPIYLRQLSAGCKRLPSQLLFRAIHIIDPHNWYLYRSRWSTKPSISVDREIFREEFQPVSSS
jgi:hypothetical protein